MSYNEHIYLIGQKAQLLFIENDGMAFGISFGDGSMGKLALTIFRIVAVSILIYLISSLIKAKEKLGVIVCFSLILAGALGNIIDSVFYGVIFNAPYHGGIATMFPEEGGYAPLFHGNVVDMFYFPLFKFNWPEWMPWIGGNRFIFFRPIFNVADASISTGVFSLIVFYRSFFKNTEDSKDLDNSSKISESETIPE